MPLLIKNVEGKILDNITGEINNLKTVDGKFGYTDWFKIGYLEVFLQNFKKVSISENLPNHNPYGLVVNKNKSFIEIEISY
jgi:hypothetical protein